MCKHAFKHYNPQSGRWELDVDEAIRVWKSQVYVDAHGGIRWRFNGQLIPGYVLEDFRILGFREAQEAA